MTSILIAIAAYTFKHELIKPDKIFYWYDQLIKKLPKWIYYPIGGCDKCLGGQLALWHCVCLQKPVIDSILYISLTIFTVTVINYILKPTCDA